MNDDQLSYTEQELAAQMVNFMLFLNAKGIKGETDETKRAKFKADKRNLIALQAQIELNMPDAISHCIETYGPIVKQVFRAGEEHEGFN